MSLFKVEVHSAFRALNLPGCSAARFITRALLTFAPLACSSGFRCAGRAVQLMWRCSPCSAEMPHGATGQDYGQP